MITKRRVVITPPHPTPPNKDNAKKRKNATVGRFSGRRQIEGIPQEYTTHEVTMEMGGENVTYIFPPLLFGGATISVRFNSTSRRHPELTRHNFEIKGICT